jgi:hypothetical protein
MADGPVPHAAKLLSRPNCCHQPQCLPINWDMHLLKHYNYNLGTVANAERVHLFVCPSPCLP